MSVESAGLSGSPWVTQGLQSSVAKHLPHLALLFAATLVMSSAYLS